MNVKAFSKLVAAEEIYLKENGWVEVTSNFYVSPRCEDFVLSHRDAVENQMAFDFQALRSENEP